MFSSKRTSASSLLDLHATTRHVAAVKSDGYESKKKGREMAWGGGNRGRTTQAMIPSAHGHMHLMHAHAYAPCNTRTVWRVDLERGSRLVVWVLCGFLVASLRLVHEPNLAVDATRIKPLSHSQHVRLCRLVAVSHFRSSSFRTHKSGIVVVDTNVPIFDDLGKPNVT